MISELSFLVFVKSKEEIIPQGVRGCVSETILRRDADARCALLSLIEGPSRERVLVRQESEGTRVH